METNILDDFRLSNNIGQKEPQKRINELTCIPQYQKDREPPLLQAAHARTDIEQTPEGIAHNLALMGSNMKCEQCGEILFKGSVHLKIEEIIKKTKILTSELTILEYDKVA